MPSTLHALKVAMTVAIFGAFCLHGALAQSVKIERTADTHDLRPLPIYIGGRVLAQDDSANQRFGGATYTYQWPGTYFVASFRGREAHFRVGEGSQILHVIVDQQPPAVLIKPEAGVYRISGLAARPHVIRIEVVTESQSSPESFEGFGIPRSGTALAAPHHAREIEFIGDSHTVGYGNSSGKRQCSPDEIWGTTDTSAGFGPTTAAHYHADYQINAISGRGIVRNYNGFPADTVPESYPYVLFDKRKAYSDSSWRPQIIVVALGTNDFSTPLRPGEKWKTRDDLHADYEATYVRFLSSLRARNPGVFFILWATDDAAGEIQTEVQRVIAKLNAGGDYRVTFIPVNGLSMTACDWHPSVADVEVISHKINDFVDVHPELWQGK